MKSSASENVEKAKKCGGQYLTFILNNEEYGVEILNVMEIRGWEEPMPLPESPNFVKGVTNLRGKVIPIIDLRRRFSLGDFDYNEMNVIIVIQVMEDNLVQELGLIVDGVSDVHSFSSEQLKAPPEMATGINVEYISALATTNNRMIILLDTNRLFSVGELREICKHSNSGMALDRDGGSFKHSDNSAS